MVKMVLAGKVNKELVTLLSRNHGKALGLCGIDGDMLRAERKFGANGEDWVMLAILPVSMNSRF